MNYIRLEISNISTDMHIDSKPSIRIDGKFGMGDDHDLVRSVFERGPHLLMPAASKGEVIVMFCQNRDEKISCRMISATQDMSFTAQDDMVDIFEKVTEELER